MIDTVLRHHRAVGFRFAAVEFGVVAVAALAGAVGLARHGQWNAAAAVGGTAINCLVVAGCGVLGWRHGAPLHRSLRVLARREERRRLAERNPRLGRETREVLVRALVPFWLVVAALWERFVEPLSGGAPRGGGGGGARRDAEDWDDVGD